jgi:hypothetical protein
MQNPATTLPESLSQEENILSPVYRDPSLWGSYIDDEEAGKVFCSPRFICHVILEKYLHDEAHGTDIPMGAALISLLESPEKIYKVRKGGGRDPRLLYTCSSCKGIFTSKYDELICDPEHSEEFRDRFAIKSNVPVDDKPFNKNKGDIHFRHEYRSPDGRLYLIEVGPIRTTGGACKSCMRGEKLYLKHAVKLFRKDPDEFGESFFSGIFSRERIASLAQSQAL